MGIKQFFKVTNENGEPIQDKAEVWEEKDLANLEGLRVVIDTPPVLHAAIRGMPNIDSMTYNGQITSHLNVIFFNAIKFKRLGIDQLWVFDGKPPQIKRGELEKRKKGREKAKKDAKKAKKKADEKEIERLKKISYQLEDYVYTSTQMLLTRMGISWAIAPEEAEAYCAHLNRKGEYDYVMSPDSDCFMFGANNLIRPIRNTQNKKKQYHVYDREEVLEHLGIDQDELINIGLCLGTDFSEKVPRVGIKTAAKKVLLGNITFTDQQKKAKHYFLNAPKSKGAKVKAGKFDKQKLIKFLYKRGFNVDRLAGHFNDLEMLNT